MRKVEKLGVEKMWNKYNVWFPIGNSVISTEKMIWTKLQYCQGPIYSCNSSDMNQI